MQTAWPIRGTALGALALAATLLWPGQPPAAAQEWPTRPIRLVNPAPAGSPTDLLARALAPGLATRLGQPVMVVNQDSAAGSAGIATVARAAPDGYTFGFSPTMPLIGNPMMRPDTGYKPDALEAVCQTFDHSFAIVVMPASPLRSLAELIAAGRAGGLRYGHAGIGSLQHIAGASLAAAAGAAFEPSALEDDGPVMLEVAAGQVDFGIVAAALAVGQPVRVLGVFAAERSPGFPDVPTMKEAGIDVTITSYGGLLAPAGLAEPVRLRLEAACAGAVTDDAYSLMAERTLQPVGYALGSAAFADRMQSEVQEKPALLRRIGLMQ